MRAFKEKDNKQVIFWYYIQKRRFIIHPEIVYANNIFSHSLIHNLKHKTNMFQDLSIQMKIPLEKHRLDNSVKQQIHQIIFIIIKNGKIEYRRSTYAKNEVVIEPCWISDSFELHEP